MKHIEIYIKWRRFVINLERKLIKFFAKNQKKMPKIAKVVLKLYVLYVNGVINLDSMISKMYLGHRRRSAKKQKAYIKNCWKCKNCVYHLERSIKKYLCYRRRYLYFECKFSKAYLRYRRFIFCGEMKIVRMFSGCRKYCKNKKKRLISMVIKSYIFYRTRVFCMENKLVKMNLKYQRVHFTVERIGFGSYLAFRKIYLGVVPAVCPMENSKCRRSKDQSREPIEGKKESKSFSDEEKEDQAAPRTPNNLLKHICPRGRLRSICFSQENVNSSSNTTV